MLSNQHPIEKTVVKSVRMTNGDRMFAVATRVTEWTQPIIARSEGKWFDYMADEENERYTGMGYDYASIHPYEVDDCLSGDPPVEMAIRQLVEWRLQQRVRDNDGNDQGQGAQAFSLRRNLGREEVNSILDQEPRVNEKLEFIIFYYRIQPRHAQYVLQNYTPMADFIFTDLFDQVKRTLENAGRWCRSEFAESLRKIESEEETHPVIESGLPVGVHFDQMAENETFDRYYPPEVAKRAMSVIVIFTDSTNDQVQRIYRIRSNSSAVETLEKRPTGYMHLVDFTKEYMQGDISSISTHDVGATSGVLDLVEEVTPHFCEGALRKALAI